MSNYQGLLTSYGYSTQSQNFLDPATMSSAAGSNYSTAGFINAGGTFLSGAGQVANRWYMMNLPTTPNASFNYGNPGGYAGNGMGYGGVY